MTGYKLAPDAPAALRHRGKKGADLYRKQALPGGRSRWPCVAVGVPQATRRLGCFPH
jgi:hypothetical protein